ncbi:MAG: LiaI-LiaF-like domain-containing protein [Acidimicrobiia bacterium]
MEPPRRIGTPRPIFWGLALITIGVAFLLRELDALPDISFWTFFWLGLGGWLFAGTLAGSRRGWFWPLTLIAIGTAMLLRDLDYIDEDFAIWPIVVIAFGVAMLLEAGTRYRFGQRTTRPEPRRFDG